jgi:hypothetical protein
MNAQTTYAVYGNSYFNTMNFFVEINSPARDRDCEYPTDEELFFS